MNFIVKNITELQTDGAILVLLVICWTNTKTGYCVRSWVRFALSEFSCNVSMYSSRTVITDYVSFQLIKRQDVLYLVEAKFAVKIQGDYINTIILINNV